MTQYLFFSGKGGVGKTTMAATTAVYESMKGRRTLLVSTDPAGNLGDIFEQNISIEPVRVMPQLDVVQMDSDAITNAYKDRMLEPLRAILDGPALEQVKEEFNGGCTIEIATFDRFTDFLEDVTYDLIVFDTAPTGHTLRLMTLPGEWDKYILMSSEGSGQTCIGPVSQIEGARAKYSNAVKMMQDSNRTTVYLVSRPEKTSVYETLRARTELERTGIHNFHLIINGVYPNSNATSGIFGKLADNQMSYIKELRSRFPNRVTEVPMQYSEVKGATNITLLGHITFDRKNATISNGFSTGKKFHGYAPASQLIEKLESRKQSQIAILTGKGGVGKTIAACSLAMKLAEKGKTLLFTTDPAAHIGQVLEAPVNHLPMNISGNLWAVNVDQKEAVISYREKVIAEARGNGYSDDLILALEEELESPCTEEIAIFEQFARLLREPEWDFFVLDTAPTGHTLRLLELPFEYRNQLDMKKNGHGDPAASYTTSDAGLQIDGLIKKLKNPLETTFIMVAYPEYTPLNETYRAMKDLERVGIVVHGAFMNTILEEKDCTDEFSRERWKLQQHYLYKASELFSGKPLYPILLQPDEIIGLTRVKDLAETTFRSN